MDRMFIGIGKAIILPEFGLDSCLIFAENWGEFFVIMQQLNLL